MKNLFLSLTFLSTVISLNCFANAATTLQTPAQPKAATEAAAAPTSEQKNAANGWEKTGDDDGITTYRKEVPGSSLVAFRGEAVIDAPIAKVANLLIDTSRKKEWVARIGEAKDIRTISEFERVEYNHTLSPVPQFILMDRDFVFHAKAVFDKAKKQVNFVMKSIEDPLMPVQEDKIRGHLNEGNYLLTSIEDGKKTALEIEISADPKGSVAAWIVNLFQKSWPRTTIENIRKQVLKPDVVEHAGVKRVLEAPLVAEAPAVTADTGSRKVSGVKKASALKK